MWKMLLANFSGNHSSSESRNAAYFPVADWSAKFLAAPAPWLDCLSNLKSIELSISKYFSKSVLQKKASTSVHSTKCTDNYLRFAPHALQTLDSRRPIAARKKSSYIGKFPHLGPWNNCSYMNPGVHRGPPQRHRHAGS